MLNNYKKFILNIHFIEIFIKSHEQYIKKMKMKMKVKIIIYFFILLIFLPLKSENIFIYINNDNKFSEYEENIDFSKFTTEIKTVALYLPQFHITEINNKYWGKGFTEWTNVKKSKPKFKGHHQPRFPGDVHGYLGYYDLADIKTIEKQINLAKSHGIYGFAIYYYWFSGKMLLEKPINNFIQNSYINFNFLLIWANENWSKLWNGGNKEIIIKQEYKPNDPIQFIKDIKKYVKDKRYIKIEEKPVIGLYEAKKVPNLQKTLKIWREKSKELGIGEIFILICINQHKIMDFQKLNLFDGSYEFPPRNSIKNHILSQRRVYLYPELLYKSRDFKENNLNLKKFPFFRGAMIEWDNSPRRKKKYIIFDRYSPEYFYIFNKIIADWTIKHYYKDMRYIFINAWNEWGEGSYLEPDEKYGYASINALSKAIFNLSYTENLKSIGKMKVAVLLGMDNEDSIKEIINKINNIPYIFDLFIVIKNEININKMKNYIFLNSNKNQQKVIILINRKNNLLEFIFILRNKLKNYKYICNMNTFHYKNISYFQEWKNYIFNNLLGDSKIISEIVKDLEFNKNLGMIFPKQYYKSLITFGDQISSLDLNYLNISLNQIHYQVNITQLIFDFPEGNMFWARISAIFPIFNLISKAKSKSKLLLILKEYLEKIWIFLLKINGFLYKTIFKQL